MRWRPAREFVVVGVRVLLREDEVVDEERNDEGRTKVRSASSGASRCGVKVRTEGLGHRRDPEVGSAVEILRGKRGKRGEKMRTDEGFNTDQEWAALAHGVVDGELKTAAGFADSGE